MNSRFFPVLFLALLPFLASGQTKYSVSLSAGVDQNLFHLLNLEGENYNSIPDFNSKIDFSAYMGSHFRLRGELGYSNLSYTCNFGFPIADENLHLSKLSINTISINPKIDYRFFSIGKFDLYGTSGFRFEFGAGDYGRSVKYSGEKSDSDYIAESHSTALAGATGGLIAKYNISSKFAMQISPEYTVFFRGLYEKNNRVMQRESINLGLEWKF